ncbi:MAG: 3-phosphoshikimate 1-carboxyvinyltransferase [Solirubrobacterales bacterium]|jgi:3-phosphoshikimate 1-carboxyvinyltransferase|nr:3-phosphoshikimate 1-carboxyvinyltransferase [Solirubrobacterales bacterium]
MTRFEPAALRGALTPPPDKSISHRAAIVAAMGEGETRIENYLVAEDTISTLAAAGAVGAEVERDEMEVRVRGAGLRGARAAAIDVGNAGTLLRLLPGWLAGQPGGEWTLDGDESIRRRPVDRVAEPLALMGAEVEARDGRLPPLIVRGAALRGIEYRLPVASAQVKSCLLLAGLLAEGSTSVIERRPTRDHTERMLRAAGGSVRTENASTPVTIHGELPAKRVTVEPAERLEPGVIVVPGDFSSAAFFLVGALLVRGSEVRLEGVGINPGRIGLLGILTRMGAAIEVIETAAAGPEPVATIVARSGPLQATRVGGGEVPLAIDELPLVALAACFADGETVVSGAEELRHKESDRIATVVDGLAGLGASIEATEDGFAVAGTGGLRGGTIDAAGDHRLAMLGAIAGIGSEEGVEVGGFDAAGVSYPGFGSDLAQLAG